MRFIKMIHLILLLGLSIPAAADVPRTINVQGYLTDANGVGISGTNDVTFKLFDTAGNPVGSPSQWTEIWTLTTSPSGNFNIILGTKTLFSACNIDWNTPYEIEIRVGSDPPMTPRIPINSVAYAMNVPDGVLTNAKYAIGSVGTTTIAYGAVMGGNIGGNTITASNIAPGSITIDRLSGGDGVRPGTIILWSGASCPTGYTRLSAFDGRFPRGALTYGGTGGSDTHTHSGSTGSAGNHSHTYSATTNAGDNAYVDVQQLGGGSIYPCATRDHTHNVSGSTSTNGDHSHTISASSSSNVPNYFNVLLCIKN